MTPEEQAAKEFRLKQLQEAEQFLEDMLKAETIPLRAYCKAQVAIAHDYLVDHQRPSRAADALRRCNPEYFKEEQRLDMAEDPSYQKAVIKLAQALVAMGLIDTVPMPRFTQALGLA